MAEFWYCLRGEIDLGAAPRLRGELSEIIHQTGDHLVIDCSGLILIDCAGIAVLSEAQKHLEAAKRHMVLVNVKPGPRRSLETLGWSDLLAYDHEPAT